MRRYVLAAILLLSCAAPANALTVENASEAVLYCSVYRQGYDMPLTQFVLLPGKKHTWTPALPTSHPLVVRAMAERRLVKCIEPATYTVHDHSATVYADRDKDTLILDVHKHQPIR